MKSPAKDALMDIIKGMKKLNLEKMKGYESSKDEDPSIEIEEQEDDEDEDED